METAGRLVEDETLRAALKENGIGRPSTRAAIIETLFKRHYIRKERKNLLATPTGIELIDIIHEELLKSAELTGIWEKKLRDIEHQKYDAQQFIDELKQQITEIVRQVLADNTNRYVSYTPDAQPKSAAKTTSGTTIAAGGTTSTKKTIVKGSGTRKKKSVPTADSPAATSVTNANASAIDPLVGQPCPICGKGHIIKGHAAYGCSEWRNGCTFRQPF
jgi:DNA topoisomerase-3